MKSTFWVLTFLVAAMTIAPRQSLGQYAWVPVYSDAEAQQAYNTAPGQTGYATYVGVDEDDTSDDADLKDFDGGKGKGDTGKGGCKSGCGCLSCRDTNTWSRAFVGVEYLHWWSKERTLPPLVAAGLGQPPVFGGEAVGGNLQVGGRITGGLWLDDCETSAIVLRAFGNEGTTSSFNVGPGAAGPFGIPFTDPPATPGFLTVSNGGTLDQVTANATNDVVGGDLYYKTLLNSGSDYRFDLLGGFQYTRIDDDLTLYANSNAAPVIGNFQDRFNATNDFAGGEIGLLGELYQGPVTIQLMGKVGVGNMRQKVAISGARTSPGTLTNGIFAHSGLNAGVWERNEFAWSPELSIKGVWHLRENISLTVGYSMLYWDNVVLAGDQVNTTVPAAIIAGTAPAGPATFSFNDTDFWVQTIDLGLAVKY